MSHKRHQGFCNKLAVLNKTKQGLNRKYHNCVVKLIIYVNIYDYNVLHLNDIYIYYFMGLCYFKSSLTVISVDAAAASSITKTSQ